MTKKIRIRKAVAEAQAKKRVNVDFPLPLLKAIDAECDVIGITRQSWIKMACDEHLRETRTTRGKNGTV